MIYQVLYIFQNRIYSEPYLEVIVDNKLSVNNFIYGINKKHIAFVSPNFLKIFINTFQCNWFPLKSEVLYFIL